MLHNLINKQNTNQFFVFYGGELQSSDQVAPAKFLNHIQFEDKFQSLPVKMILMALLSVLVFGFLF